MDSRTDSVSVVDDTASCGVWLGQLVLAAQSWRLAADGERKDRALGTLWPLLNLALTRFARAHLRRLGSLQPDDVADLAAEKALGLLGQLETGRWDPAACALEQVTGFLSTVARNGVIDRLRLHARETLTLGPAAIERSTGNAEPVSGGGDPDLELARREYAAALCACAAQLSQRTRLVWFLRVFHELSSRQIASHALVKASPGAVDLLLARARTHIRRCMAAKGLPLHEVPPPGTFFVLWRLIHARSPAAED